jgi:ComF family protein
MPHASLTQRLWARTEGTWLRAKHWPSLCHICQAWPSQALCSGCVERFAQPLTRCPTCALALHTRHCPQCATTPPLFLDACLAAVSYQFPWSDCVTRFKFQADPGLGRSLAELMRHAPWVEPALERASRVVAMPLSRARLRERGFNQAFELARHLAPDKADAHTLQRTEQSAHQVGASRDDRLANVRDAFWVDPAQLGHMRGQRVVLVDDVMTTGASLNEAARALKAAGATHVTGLVFARTEAPPEH